MAASVLAGQFDLVEVPRVVPAEVPYTSLQSCPCGKTALLGPWTEAS